MLSGEDLPQIADRAERDDRGVFLALLERVDGGTRDLAVLLDGLRCDGSMGGYVRSRGSRYSSGQLSSVRSVTSYVLHVADLGDLVERRVR